MVNQQILEGLKFALAKGHTLKEAMMSFYNSGYKKEEIEEAARELYRLDPKNPAFYPNSSQKQASSSNIPQNKPENQKPLLNKSPITQNPLLSANNTQNLIKQNHLGDSPIKTRISPQQPNPNNFPKASQDKNSIFPHRSADNIIDKNMHYKIPIQTPNMAPVQKSVSVVKKDANQDTEKGIPLEPVDKNLPPPVQDLSETQGLKITEQVQDVSKTQGIDTQTASSPELSEKEIPVPPLPELPPISSFATSNKKEGETVEKEETPEKEKAVKKQIQTKPKTEQKVSEYSDSKKKNKMQLIALLIILALLAGAFIAVLFMKEKVTEWILGLFSK